MPSLSSTRHTFAFRTADGELVFRELTTAEFFELDDATIATRSPDDEVSGAADAPYTARTEAWPIRSEALAVHPSQRAEAEERARRCGVPTSYDPAGRPILTGPEHRRRLMKLDNAFDRQSYY